MDSNYSLSDITSALGGNSSFGGENALILIILFAFIFGGNGFLGNKGTDTATGADIQRAVDLNALQSGQAGIAADIQRGIYEINSSTKDAAYNNLSEIRDVGAAVSTNGANIINALTGLQSNMQNCCCETKSTIMENRYLDSQNAANLMSAIHSEGEATRNMIQQDKIATLTAQVNELKTQNMFCGIPKVNPYLYNLTPNCGCGCNV